MKTITYRLIKSYGPCYDPIKYIPKNYKASILSFLKRDDIPIEDQLWLILRKNLLPKKLLYLFAIWNLKKGVKLIKDPDSRIIDTIKILERYVNGKASYKELDNSAKTAFRAVTHLSVFHIYYDVYHTVSCASIPAATLAVASTTAIPSDIGYNNTFKIKQKAKLIELIKMQKKKKKK